MTVGSVRTAEGRDAAAALLAGEGVLSAAQVRATVEGIAALQRPDGAIPWFHGGHLDPWDHVEAAMALDAAGLPDRALAAYRWLAASQNPDGSWYAAYADAPGRRERADEPAARDQLQRLHSGRRLAPLAGHRRRGLPGRDVAGGAARDGLRAEPADPRRGDPVVPRRAGPRRRRGAADRLLVDVPGAALRAGDRRAARERAAGLGAGAAAGSGTRWPRTRSGSRTRARTRWTGTTRCSGRRCAARRPSSASQRAGTRSWCPDSGVRCVTPNPWVTGGETCELALALWAIGDAERARTLLRDIQHLRDEADGMYWTGYVFEADDQGTPAIWPRGEDRLDGRRAAAGARGARRGEGDGRRVRGRRAARGVAGGLLGRGVRRGLRSRRRGRRQCCGCGGRWLRPAWSCRLCSRPCLRRCRPC